MRANDATNLSSVQTFQHPPVWEDLVAVGGQETENYDSFVAPLSSQLTKRRAAETTYEECLERGGWTLIEITCWCSVTVCRG